jgi:hypothetical protein
LDDLVIDVSMVLGRRSIALSLALRTVQFGPTRLRTAYEQVASLEKPLIEHERVQENRSASPHNGVT